MYLFKFTPILFHKLWGGQTIRKWYPNCPANYQNVGESWVLSAVEKYPSVVANGHHAGDTLSDLLEVYMDELVGEKVWSCYGATFPLLIKFIDADDDLSIQVHPNDEQAFEMENGSLGKTEMWYVLPSSKEASIYLGWKEDMTEQAIREMIADGSLADKLLHYPVAEGDTAVIRAGQVHAMRRGTIVAEIQENSDITYRLYDYNRVGNDGRMRPLKLDKALSVLDYQASKDAVEHHPNGEHNNGAQALVQTPYFTTNRLSFDRVIVRDYAPLDSFVAFVCVAGQCRVTALDAESEDAEERSVTLTLGEAVLVPACFADIALEPLDGECQLLEVYLDKL